MNLPPFDPDAFAPIAALLAKDAPMPVTPPYSVAAQIGLHLPVKPGDGALRLLVDADGSAFAVLMPTGGLASDQHRAEALAAALNIGLALLGPSHFQNAAE